MNKVNKSIELIKIYKQFCNKNLKETRIILENACEKEVYLKAIERKSFYELYMLDLIQLEKAIKEDLNNIIFD